jgi:uncharacterized membrane protein YoaK (UPF0700 family)
MSHQLERTDVRRRVDAVLVALAGAAGWLDAASYMRVHVFTANMTGNTVLFGLGAAGWPQASAIKPLAGIVAFLLGSFAGAALGAAISPARRASRTILIVEILLLAAVAVLWCVLRLASDAEQIGLIVVAALAMGLQQAATEQLHPSPSASSTYMSGTVERIGSGLYELLSGKPSKFAFNALAWLAFLLAAFLVGRVAGTSSIVLGVVPLVIVVAAAIAVSVPSSTKG